MADKIETICVSSTFTIDLLEGSLSFWNTYLDLNANISFAPYNQVFQMLLDSNSLLSKNTKGYNIIVFRWQDFVSLRLYRKNESSIDNWFKKLDKIASELYDALQKSTTYNDLPHIIVLAPSKIPGKKSHERLQLFDRCFKEKLDTLNGVYSVTAEKIDEDYPIDGWYDAESERFGHMPFTDHYFIAMATIIFRCIIAIRSKPRKVIVLDCDNTLWKGVCGEVGPKGVTINSSFEYLQNFMANQAKQGKVLCLCSKNVESDVMEVFKQRTEMPLNLKDIVSWRINWNSKSNNLKALAKELKLGLDSFIFLDDNPVECAEVEAVYPEVLTLPIPSNSDNIPDLLKHCWAFDQLKTTGEDRIRVESYQMSIKRDHLKKQSNSFADFFNTLELQIDIRKAVSNDIPRISQLSQRTNQFNTTTLRRNNGDFERICLDPNSHCLVVRVRDRFGDYGLVGVAVAHEFEGSLDIDSLMLSCRALGKGVEYSMMAALGNLAKERKLKQINLQFAHSSRNRPAHKFIEHIGNKYLKKEVKTFPFTIPSQIASTIRFDPMDTDEDQKIDDNKSISLSIHVVDVWPDPKKISWIAEKLNNVENICTEIGKTTRHRPSLSQPYVEPSPGLEKTIAEIFEKSMGVKEVGIYDNFKELGGKSIHLVRVHALLLKKLNISLDITTLFDHPTVASLTAYLEEKEKDDGLKSVLHSAERFRNIRVGIQQKNGKRQFNDQDLSSLSTNNFDDVAIIGMAGRFPGASNVQAFWQNIKTGVESISHFEIDELDVMPDQSSPDATSTFVPAKGILEDVDMFDAKFFGYYPKEAAFMDPQHRVFLENCWEALENAGYDPYRYDGAIAVYAGCYMDTYLLSNLCSSPEFLHRLVESIQVGTLQTELGNDKDYLATRVAYKLNLRGPCLTVQTACSTSMVAISHACQSLQNYQADMALAGGVTITFPHKKGYFYREGGMVSGDGHCRAFDADAQGTVFSNASAVVVLKRLKDAIAERDTIYAVIKGHSCNNDGSQKLSFTAPTVQGQAEVIAMAQATAGVDSRSIDYIEAHGTGTPLGDPIEIQALSKVFRKTTEDRGFCAIGSLKTNIGHLDVASGATGVIKTALSLYEKVLPPSLNYNRPNPNIDFKNSPFYVNTTLKPWIKDNGLRRAGVSSFGVGGTNAHVVMEEGPERNDHGREVRPNYLLLLSAKSENALRDIGIRLSKYLRENPEVQLSDVAYTLQFGRTVFQHRRIVVCRDHEDACTKLEDPKVNPLNRFNGTVKKPPIIFMFPGQGAQFPNMARDLYYNEPVFREHFDHCASLLIPLIGSDLRDLLYTQENEQAAAESLRETAITQPSIFSIEYALAKLWMHWGLKPEAFVGHSVGELTAASLANVFSLEEALKLVTTRGQLMQKMPRGAMLSVRASVDVVESLLTTDISVAAINAPELIVVSGPFEAIDNLALSLKEKGIPYSKLHSSHAFHSSMMDPVFNATIEAVSKIDRNPPSIPIFSTTTGRWLSDEEAVSPNHWGRNLRDTVRFADAVDFLQNEKQRAFIEVGPGQTLTTLAKQTIGVKQQPLVYPSLGHAKQQGADYETLLTTAGRLWLLGFQFDWERFANSLGYRIPLPTYPFERMRHWVEPIPYEQTSALTPSANSEPNITGSVKKNYNTKKTVPTTADLIVRKQLQLMAQQLKMMRNRS